MKDVIISLCDLSGAWSRPYIALGYRVIRVDPSHGEMVTGERGLITGNAVTGTVVQMEDGGEGWAMTAGEFARWLAEEPGRLGHVRGVMMAPPCTDFSGSGARHWHAKDRDGRTAASVAIIHECMAVKHIAEPDWWVLENPAGRLQRLVPEVGPRQMIFHPHHFAGLLPDPAVEAYTKRTCLWGSFNTELVKADVEPVMHTTKDGKRGSWMWAKLGGKSAKTKALRSKTPDGFAIAFAKANP
jgi:hypothetical protein